MIPRNIKAYRNSVVGIKLAFLGHEITQLESGQGFQIEVTWQNFNVQLSLLGLGGIRNLDLNPQAAVF